MTRCVLVLCRRNGRPHRPRRTRSAEVLAFDSGRVEVRTHRGDRWFDLATGLPMRRDRTRRYYAIPATSLPDLETAARRYRWRGIL